MLAQMADGSFEADAMRGMPSKDLLDLARDSRRGRRLLRPSRCVERDRMGRPGLTRAATFVLGLDRRDAWEPVEAVAGREENAARENARVR